MRNIKGFTLIEVVVITLIIAVLSMLIAPSFKNSTVTSDIEKAKMSLIEFTNAVKLYKEVSGETIGYFTYSAWEKLANSTINGFACLQTPNRWEINYASLMTFKGLDCIYSFETLPGVLSMAMCKFPEYNGGEGKDCYWFTIYKDNPVVVKKDLKDNENLCNAH